MSAKRFLLYARKSTDDAERQVRSIDDQIAELRDLARKEKLTISRVFIEKQTAKVPGRPVFNEMLDCIENGEASGILAWHPDRLARNSVDGGRIIYMVDTGRIAALKLSRSRSTRRRAANSCSASCSASRSITSTTCRKTSAAASGKS
jgi:DNA invertase Pin-like site-specific DNA recombinase